VSAAGGKTGLVVVVARNLLLAHWLET
jgi:hypothetical protein